MNPGTYMQPAAPDFHRCGNAPAFTREGAEPVPAASPADSELPRPHLDYDVRRGLWYLASPYTIAHQDHILTIPAGFTLNLASIPRPLWWLIASHELGLIGPLVHDFLYGCQGNPGPACDPEREFTRKEADRFFLETMKREGVKRLKRQAAYRAVRWFGHFAWRG